MAALYRLGQSGTQAGGRQELGPLPSTSVALLSVLAAVWILLGIRVLIGAMHKKRHANRG